MKNRFPSYSQNMRKLFHAIVIPSFSGWRSRMRSDWGRIIAAGWLVAAACAEPGRASEPTPFASVGETTWAPVGWVELCASRPWECGVAPIPPREVVLTPKAWDTLVRVNRY